MRQTKSNIVPVDQSNQVLDVVRSVTDNWINKASPISDTIFETNQLIQQMSKDDFEDNVDQLAELLEKSRNADGKKIFQDRNQAEKYLRELRKKGSKKLYSTKKIKQVETETDPEQRLENEYSKELSPLMKRSRIEKTITKTMFLKSEL